MTIRRRPWAEESTSRPASGRLDGAPIGRLVRNSTERQIGNWSAVEQETELDRLIEREGGLPVPYDEQATSGRDLSKRKVALQMLADVDAGKLRGIAAYDIKRLTRDEYGVDGATIAKRLIAARAVLVTRSRVFELWNESDLMTFQIECFISGIDIRNIKRTLWRGLFARAAREVFFMTPPIGYTTRIAEVDGIAQGDDRVKIKRLPMKDDAQAPMIAELMRAFDDCASLGEVVRHMNASGLLHTSKKRPYRGKQVPWTTDRIWKMLRNPIYSGRWEFGYTCDKKNPIWEEHREKVLTHEVPELGYWTPAQAIRWQEKFAARATRPAVRMRRHLHPLLGVLACASCGRTMVSAGRSRNGQNRYWCPVRHNKGACASPQTIAENIALKVLREHLSEIVVESERLLEEAIRQESDDSRAKELERQLEAMEAELNTASDEWMAMKSPRPRALGERIQQIEADMDALRERVEAERARSLVDQDALAVCQLLAEDPVHLFDQMDTRGQGRVLRTLVSDVRIEGRGIGPRRESWLAGYSRVITQPSVPSTR